MNHETIANKFAESLLGIGLEIQHSEDLLKAFSSRKPIASVENLVRLAAQLCTKILRFLIIYMKWSQKRCKRLKGSLDKNYYQTHVQGPYQDILMTSRYLSREAELQKSKIVIKTETLAQDSLLIATDAHQISTENLEISRNMYRLLKNRLDLSSIENVSKEEMEVPLKKASALCLIGG